MAGKKRKFACHVDIKTLVDFDCYFDLLGALVIVLDKSGKIDLFNSGAEEILGHKAEEVLGKSWINNFIPKEIRGEIRKVFNSVIRGEEKFTENYINEALCKDGKRITLKWHSSAIRDKNNKILGLIATAADVTDLARAKSDLIEKIAQMEKMNNLMIGRELKMAELKKEIQVLKESHEKK